MINADAAITLRLRQTPALVAALNNQPTRINWGVYRSFEDNPTVSVIQDSSKPVSATALGYVQYSVVTISITSEDIAQLTQITNAIEEALAYPFSDGSHSFTATISKVNTFPSAMDPLYTTLIHTVVLSN